MAKQDLSKYYLQRANDLNFDPEKHFAYYSANPDESVGKKIKQPLIWPDDKGNICIGYIGLDGDLLIYDAATAKSKVDIQPIHWKRYREPKGDQRYGPCKNGIGVFAWNSPKLIKDYNAGKKIKRLVITEGPLKALKAYIEGMPYVMAIPSITIWKPKGDHEVFYNIMAIIDACEVDEVLFLTDGDTLQVKWEPRKDLYKRPNSFCTAVNIFKDLLRHTDVRLLYGHINDDEPKGLDDILIEKPEVKGQLKKELFNVPEKYIHTTINDITRWGYHQIRSYFGVAESTPEKFYTKYEQYIGLNEFVYKQGLYKYDEKALGVEYLKQGESARFERIGKTFFIQGTKPTKRGTLENILVPITVDEIKHMYPRKSQNDIKTIIRDIDYYNGAMNRPSHHEYKKCIETYDENGNILRWYNVYRKLTHQLQPGGCPHSMRFIKHVFGEDDIEYNGMTFKSYELGLDYIKLLWEHPQQMLPILCLVSKHRHTGKTTFWNWMRAIYQQNVRFVRVEHLTGQFTSFFANSLLVVVDEALIEKRATMERVKALVTAETFTMEAKHQNAEEVDNFVKVGISSNNINNFAQIDQDEVRFWVREIDPIPHEEQNFNLLADLEKEISAFLNLLEEREFVTKSESRAWFHHELIKTDALRRVVERSRSGKELLVEGTLIDHMTVMGKTIIELSAKDLKDLIGRDEINGNDIRWVVEDKWNIFKCRTARTYTLYSQSEDFVEEGFTITHTKKRSTFYSFHASQFFKPDDLIRIFPVVELLELEEKLIEDEEETFYSKIQLEILLQKKKYRDIYEMNPEKQETIKESKDEFTKLSEWDDMMNRYNTLL